MSNANECHCFIRHARTISERAEVVKALEYARSVSDSTGIAMAIASLGECAADARKTKATI